MERSLTMKGGTTTGWGGREAVEKVKNTNEPKFDQAGVEISKKGFKKQMLLWKKHFAPSLPCITV